MPEQGITLKCYRARRPPDEAHAIAQDTNPWALPDAFAGYQRSDTQYMVMAVRDSDDIVVGMSVAWRFEQALKEPLLWICAAEVNEPYRNASLERELIESLASFALQEGAGTAYVAERLHHFMQTKAQH